MEMLANTPCDEDWQLEWALRESMRQTGRSGVAYSPLCAVDDSRPLVGTERCNINTPPSGRASGSGSQITTGRSYWSSSVSQTLFDLELARSKALSQPRVDIILQGDAKVRLEKT